MANEVRATASVKDNASKELDRIRDKIAKLQKEGPKGFAIGAGAAVTAGAIGAVTTAASQFADVIGDSVKAAMADEASQQRLRTALLANVPAWDGNTKSIEKTLKARENLGFADDETRDSLARIVAATHDVNAALRIQATAMDLARFKGISLADASDALIKVEGGQYRALKALGIVLKEGATQQDALNAVQKVAAGQAAAYADTTEGKLLVAQTKINEAMETFGYTILPAVGEALSTISKALDSTNISFSEMDRAARRGSQAAQGRLDSMSPAARAAAIALDQAGKAEDDLAVASISMADKVEKSNAAVSVSTRDMTDTLIKEARRLISGAFDPIEAKYDIRDARMELDAAIAKRTAAKGAKAQRDAARDVQGSLKTWAASLANLGEQGKLNQKDVKNFASEARKAYRGMSKSAQADIEALIAQLLALTSIKGVSVKASVKLDKQGNRIGKDGRKQFAAGGRTPGGTVLVGEQGPELVDLPSGSLVHTASETQRMGGGDTIINLQVMGDLRARNASEVVAAVQRAHRIARGQWVPMRG